MSTDDLQEVYIAKGKFWYDTINDKLIIGPKLLNWEEPIDEHKFIWNKLNSSVKAGRYYLDFPRGTIDAYNDSAQVSIGFVSKDMSRELFKCFIIEKSGRLMCYKCFMERFNDSREDGALYPYTLKYIFDYKSPEYLEEFKNVRRSDLMKTGGNLLSYNNVLIPIHILSYRLIYGIQPELNVEKEFNNVIIEYSKKYGANIKLNKLPTPMSIAHTLCFNFTAYIPNDRKIVANYYSRLFNLV
jgi:hypothetical protein